MAKNTVEVGREYQHFVAGYLRCHDYTGIEETPDSGDYGVDIVAYKDSKKYAVQCKYFTGSVGSAAVQEVFTGKFMPQYSCDIAMVVTNSTFTKHAVELAKVNGVILIEGVDYDWSDAAISTIKSKLQAFEEAYLLDEFPADILDGLSDIYQQLDAINEELILLRRPLIVAQKVREVGVDVDEELTAMIIEYLDKLLPSNWESLSPEARQAFVQGRSADSFGVCSLRRNAVSITEIRYELLCEDRTKGGGNDEISRRISSILNNVPGWRKYPKCKRIGVYGPQCIYCREGTNVFFEVVDAKPRGKISV